MRVVLTGIALVAMFAMLASCASGPTTTQDAYVWPAKGQGGERTGQDKAECYRVAQGFTDGVLPTGSSETGVAFAIGGFTGGAVAYEQELARRYPPDLSKYGTCLTARGYSVDWPKGKQP